MEILTNVTLKIRVKRSLVDKIEPLLKERGISLDQAVSLYLRAMVNGSENSKSLRLADEMPFGKYKGETVETIVRGDPQYMMFIFGLGKTRFDPETLALLEQVTRD